MRVKLKPLDEAECYARLHGDHDPNVRVLNRVERVAPPEPPRPPRPPVVRLSGEDLRLMFEQRLDDRGGTSEPDRARPDLPRGSDPSARLSESRLSDS